MNTDDSRSADISDPTVQSEQSMAAVAVSRHEFDASMADIMAVYKEIAERFKDTAAQIKETKALVEATTAQMKASDKKLNKMYRELNGNWSRLVESLVEGKLVELLRARNVDVTETYVRRKLHYFDDSGTRREREFDIVARNGAEVVVFEVKTTLRPEDVKWFISVMRNFPRYFPNDASKNAYGGVAYISEESKAGRHAAKQGLYVIRATGDSASIVNDAEFTPVSFAKKTSEPVRHLRAVSDC